MTDLLLLVVVATSAGGATFATVAGILRRRYGPWALFAVTVASIVLTVIGVTRLYVLEALFLAPAIPGLLVAAGVLEWRARRAVRAQVWREVVWGAAAFALTAVVALGVVLAGFRCTGCVG